MTESRQKGKKVKTASVQSTTKAYFIGVERHGFRHPEIIGLEYDNSDPKHPNLCLRLKWDDGRKDLKPFDASNVIEIAPPKHRDNHLDIG